MDISVYTDASYCHKTKVAACGYFILNKNKPIKHDIFLFQDVKNSYEAEQIAIEKGLQEAFLVNGTIKRIVLFTDSMGVVDNIRNYINNLTYSKKFMRKDLLETIDTLIECGVKVTLVYVKAHAHHGKETTAEKFNKKVDISVRTELRKYLNNK